MSPSHWGPPTWMFIHTLAEKVKEEEFPKIGQQIIANIQQPIIVNRSSFLIFGANLTEKFCLVWSQLLFLCSLNVGVASKLYY